MRKTLLAIALAALTTPIAAQAAQMKAGLWEIQIIKQVIDGRDMKSQMAAAQTQMQKAMADMPPAQRKQMEAMMNQYGASMPKADAMRVCISPAMAARDEPVVDADGSCKPSKISRSGNRTKYTIDCMQEGRRTTGTGETTFSGNAMHTRMDMTTNDAEGRHRMQNESKMTWISANCGGLKPADEMVRDIQKYAPKR